MPTEIWTAHLLRRRWKPTKERLAESAKHQPLLIRIHRACSWIQSIEALDDAALDERLVFQWIALNALYGRWDGIRREPSPEAKTTGAFFDLLFRIDGDCRLAQLLTDERALVMSIFEDPYLSGYFWEEPSAGRAKQTQSTRHSAKTWYLELIHLDSSLRACSWASLVTSNIAALVCWQSMSASGFCNGYPVSTHVNRPANDDPACAEPLA